MSNESLEQKIQGALTDLRGEAAPEVRARATAAMAAATPAPRPRYRRIAAATLAAVALIGLGFVPIPLGSAKGALDRALASAQNARTVHVTEWSVGGQTEEWLAEEGFWRKEYRSDGELKTLTLAVGPWETHYSCDAGAGAGGAWQVFDPTMLHPADMPNRAAFMRRFETLWYLSDQAPPEVHVEEHREASLWGGEVAVVEAETIVGQDNSFLFSGPYREGETIFVRAELDPRTDLLFSVQEYRVNGKQRDLVYQATYEWNVEISEELERFELPKGTKLERIAWWETRADQVIAQDSTRDWQVTLHAIDINRHGDIILSLSRVETPDSQMPSVYNSAPPLEVQATGGSGERYEQLGVFSCYNARLTGYWTTTLKPANEASNPWAITLTVRPYPRDPCQDQSVTFRNVPLPQRQNVDDVFASSQEVIQY